jgi:formate-dependent nitrite reductase membrane component NrfD
MFKLYSPMSFGSWAIAIFGIFVTIAFVGALGERDRPGFWGRFAFVRRGWLAKINAVLGGTFGFIVAGYTGVLLTVSSRPIWADTPMLGALFLISAAATSAALLGWLGRRRAHPASLAWIARLEPWLVLLEIVAIVATILTLGPAARAWMGRWGVLLAIVVLLGLIAPLALHWRRRALPLAALLAIAGGLGIRAVVILSSEAIT